MFGREILMDVTQGDTTAPTATACPHLQHTPTTCGPRGETTPEPQQLPPSSSAGGRVGVCSFPCTPLGLGAVLTAAGKSFAPQLLPTPSTKGASGEGDAEAGCVLTSAREPWAEGEPSLQAWVVWGFFFGKAELLQILKQQLHG